MNSKKLAVVAMILMVVVPIGLGYALSVEETDKEVWNVSQSVNVSDLLLNSSTDYYGTFTGTTNNTSVNGVAPQYVAVGSTVSSYPYYEIVPHTISANTVYHIPYSEWAFIIPGYSYYSLGYNGAEPSSFMNFTYSDIAVSYVGGVFKFGSIVRTDVESVAFKVDHAVTLNEYVNNDQYADISHGWTIPTNTNVVWSNGQQNVDYTLAIHIPNNDTVRLGNVAIRNTNGTVTGEYVPYPPRPDPEPVFTLGDYEYILATVSGESVTISGLASWPAMGLAPITYNSVTIPNDGNTWRIIDRDGGAVFRVESATVIAGQFPSTKDLSFDLSTLYPSASYNIKLNSIGVYGDVLTINGVDYQVDSGKITVGARSVNLKGAVISSVYDSGVYAVTINGVRLADSNNPLVVAFGGEWSLTATAEILEKSTIKSMEWVPGGFGLSREGFIAAGLLTGIGAFVVLGMTGKLSGSKIATLAFICGSAMICYFLIL